MPFMKHIYEFLAPDLYIMDLVRPISSFYRSTTWVVVNLSISRFLRVIFSLLFSSVIPHLSFSGFLSYSLWSGVFFCCNLWTGLLMRFVYLCFTFRVLGCCSVLFLPIQLKSLMMQVVLEIIIHNNS